MRIILILSFFCLSIAAYSSSLEGPKKGEENQNFETPFNELFIDNEKNVRPWLGKCGMDAYNLLKRAEKEIKNFNKNNIRVMTIGKLGIFNQRSAFNLKHKTGFSHSGLKFHVFIVESGVVYDYLSGFQGSLGEYLEQYFDNGCCTDHEIYIYDFDGYTSWTDQCNISWTGPYVFTHIIKTTRKALLRNTDLGMSTLKVR